MKIYQQWVYYNIFKVDEIFLIPLDIKFIWAMNYLILLRIFILRLNSFLLIKQKESNIWSWNSNILIVILMFQGCENLSQIICKLLKLRRKQFQKQSQLYIIYRLLAIFITYVYGPEKYLWDKIFLWGPFFMKTRCISGYKK